jgi:hypothetical protein
MARLFAAQAPLYCLAAGVPGLLGIISLTVLSLFMVRGAGAGDVDPRALWASMSFSQQLLAVFGLILGLWTPILLAARGVCRTTEAQLSQRAIAPSEVLADMTRFIPAALLYALVIGIPSMIGASILFVPGLVVASLFVLVVPVAVNEPAGMIAALKRGLTLGGQVLAKNLLIVFACAVLLGLILVFRIMFIDRFLPGSYQWLFPVRFAIVYVPALLLLVLSNICFTLLYHEARTRQTQLVPPGSGS